MAGICRKLHHRTTTLTSCQTLSPVTHVLVHTQPRLRSRAIFLSLFRAGWVMGLRRTVVLVCRALALYTHGAEGGSFIQRFGAIGHYTRSRSHMYCNALLGREVRRERESVGKICGRTPSHGRDRLDIQCVPVVRNTLSSSICCRE